MHRPSIALSWILAPLVIAGCSKHQPAGTRQPGKAAPSAPNAAAPPAGIPTGGQSAQLPPGVSPLSPAARPLAAISPDQSRARRATLNKLKQLTVAFHSYYQKNESFPPAVLVGPDGKTPHSWRVALLPLLEQDALYKQYRLNEPWDSPSNREVLARMPDVYRTPAETAGSTNAGYFVMTGPGTVFDGPKGKRMSDVLDGTADTLLVVESKRDIPWTKPEDISYDPQGPLPELGGYHEGQFGIALADGETWFLTTTIEEKTLRALITRAGGEYIGARDTIFRPW
jgi:hypothetical protein